MGVAQDFFEQYERLSRLKKSLFRDFNAKFLIRDYNVVLQVFIGEKKLEILVV